MSDHPHASGPANRRPPYAILIAVSAIAPFSLNIFIPSVPGLQRTFDVSYGTVQLTLSLALVGMAACQLFYGPLSDRYGRRPLLLAGLVLFVVASALAAFAPSIEMLILARLIQAIGGASGIVLSRAIVRDMFEREKAASVLGYITMAWVLAPMIAPVIGGALDHLAGFRASFILLTVIGILVLAAAWFALHETNLNRRPDQPLWQPARFAQLLTAPRFRGYALTLGCASTVFFTFLAAAPYLTVNVMGHSPIVYGLWFIFVSAGYMAGNFLSGRYSEKIGNDQMVQIGNWLTLAGAAATLLAALLGYLSPATLFVPVLVCALGNGLTIPNGTIGAISVDPALIGTAAGFAGFLQMGLGAVVSQAVGSLQDTLPEIGLWVMTAFAALALLVHARTMRRAGISA